MSTWQPHVSCLTAAPDYLSRTRPQALTGQYSHRRLSGRGACFHCRQQSCLVTRVRRCWSWSWPHPRRCCCRCRCWGWSSLRQHSDSQPAHRVAHVQPLPCALPARGTPPSASLPTAAATCPRAGSPRRCRPPAESSAPAGSGCPTGRVVRREAGSCGCRRPPAASARLPEALPRPSRPSPSQHRRCLLKLQQP